MPGCLLVCTIVQQGGMCANCTLAIALHTATFDGEICKVGMLFT